MTVAERVLGKDLGVPCDMVAASGDLAACAGPVDGFEDWEGDAEWLCRGHQRALSVGLYSKSGTGWPS